MLVLGFGAIGPYQDFRLNPLPAAAAAPARPVIASIMVSLRVINVST
jgi:hypothetical protein